MGMCVYEVVAFLTRRSFSEGGGEDGSHGVVDHFGRVFRDDTQAVHAGLVRLGSSIIWWIFGGLFEPAKTAALLTISSNLVKAAVAL